MADQDVNEYLEGNTIQLECEAAACGSASLVAAQFTCRVLLPDGTTIANPPVTQNGTGVKALYLPPADTPGLYTYTFRGTAPNGAACSVERQFNVAARTVP